MGNDGGSIARRTELVKTKAKPPQVDKKNQALAAWLMCALSKLPLSPPVVSCPLGKLYNKDAVIEYLISPPGTADSAGGNAGAYGADGYASASHIRSLKDVVELTLTANPDASPSEGETLNARFVCPLSQRPMNGTTRFVYNRHCGCVANEHALKQVAQESDTCRICSTARPEGEAEVLIPLNPHGDELAAMKKAWADQCAREAEVKRLKKLAKKRKQIEGDDSQAAPPVKAARLEPLKASTPRMPVAVAAATAAAAAKAAASPAIASLYAKRGETSAQDQNWMTRGTFSRYA